MRKPLLPYATITSAAALVLLAIAAVPKFLLDHGDRLVWQLDSWASIFATLFIAVAVILWTVYFAKGKHPLKKIIAGLGCVVLEMACLIGLYAALLKHDSRVWGDKDYVVYSEIHDSFDPDVFVLYKRDGLVDRRMYTLCHIYYCTVRKTSFTMYPDANLIKEETEMTDFDGFNGYHTTTFYRLSDGKIYDEEKNDSLLLVTSRL